MRSTDRRLRGLTLSHRRAEIAAFWIVTTVGAGTAIALVLWTIGKGHAWLCLGGLLVLVPRFVAPRWFELGISAWNAGVTVTAKCLRWYILKLAYYTLFAAIGRAGTSLDLVLDEPAGSRWISRSHPERSVNYAWQPWLSPFLWLLMMLPVDRDESAPLRSTYTLY